MKTIIGIDTGGTFTDAVVFDPKEERVLAKAKAITTKGDLAIGVAEAMRAAVAAVEGRATVADVALVSVSTTLATNAIVEGHGSPIAVILAGFDARMTERTGIAAALPATPMLSIAGGHDHAGEPVAPLDLARAEAFIVENAHAAEAFAIAAQYSVRNPAHELALRELVLRLTGRPATISSELASDLDAPRRALTAALNARLIGRIHALVEAIRRAMADLGIAAPLMIVKGDGTMAAADAILARPVETVLSGPAASVIGAKALSGLADFVMSDIGGTTTDIAVLENGWPRLNRAGAEVGGFRTMVRAVEMRTYGLGGDSEVDLDDKGRVTLSPRRIVPISLLADRHPAIGERLAALAESADPAIEPGRYVLRPFGAVAAGASQAALGDREARMLDKIGDAPVPLASLLVTADARRTLEKLVRAGRLQMSGFTPSDAAHVLGRQATWSREAAIAGARLLIRARRMGRPGEAEAVAFAETVIDRLVSASGRAVLETLLGRAPGGADELIDAVCEGRPALRGVAVSLRPSMPLVAVGGPAPIAYPDVGRRLGVDLRLLSDGDVANAIGAATGAVRTRVVVEVQAMPSGGWRIHAAGGLVDADDPSLALTRARDIAAAAALQAAHAMGAADARALLNVERIDLPGVTGDFGLVSALVTAEAFGAGLSLASSAN